MLRNYTYIIHEKGDLVNNSQWLARMSTEWKKMEENSKDFSQIFIYSATKVILFGESVNRYYVKRC